MADQDHAGTERARNPVPVTPSRETERPAGLAFDVEKGADLPGVPTGDQTPKNSGAAPAQETGAEWALPCPHIQPGRSRVPRLRKEGLLCSRRPISGSGGA